MATTKGNSIEIQRQLNGFGIPVDLLPITHAGTVKTSNHSQFVKFHQESERLQYWNVLLNGNDNGNTSCAADRVECPRSFDVIFKKGKSHRNHFGNTISMRNLMEANCHQYQAMKTQQEKVHCTWGIVFEIQRRNIRFLQWDKSKGGAWIHISDLLTMRKKVSQSFRVHMKRCKIDCRVVTKDASLPLLLHTQPAKRRKTL